MVLSFRECYYPPFLSIVLPAHIIYVYILSMDIAFGQPKAITVDTLVEFQNTNNNKKYIQSVYLRLEVKIPLDLFTNKG